MTANIITVFAVVAGITWLGVVFISALRSKGREQIPSNLRPGITDQELETRRLEKGQKYAIAFSAFLAISLPLYFLSEPARQEGFVEQFEEESILRGEHLVAEYKCFDCHGPGGSGGASPYIEKRSNVTVAWLAPSINDVFFLYDESEVTYWVTYGRGNTPMPAWGLPGGGPLNADQVNDVVNYLKTIQITQEEAANKVPDPVAVALESLAGAEATIADAILKQSQVVADIENAPGKLAVVEQLSEEATGILEAAEEGIDTDGDGLSDSAETGLSNLSKQVEDGLTVVQTVAMDPSVADAEKADEALATLTAAAETDPIVTPNLLAVTAALDTGIVGPGGLTADAADQLGVIARDARGSGISVPAGPYDTVGSAEELAGALDEAASADGAVAGAGDLASQAHATLDAGSDPDGDLFSTGAEDEITSQVADAAAKTAPLRAIAISPTNPESEGGQPDHTTAADYVASLHSLTLSLEVTTDNQEKLLATEKSGLQYLEESAVNKLYEIDFAGVAESMGVSEEEATRAAGLFMANCARCHTAGNSAGIPFTGEPGSGGFGPALWEGRPAVQFGPLTEPVEDDLLIQFLIRGSEANKPYGINGYGSGRMPAFGAILSLDEIELLAAYLRAGNLNGMTTP